MELLERYNRLLRTQEDTTVRLLDRTLDASFNRLIRRARVHIKAGYTDPAQRNLALLQEFRQLIPVFNPEKQDSYDLLFTDLLSFSSKQGTASARELTDLALPNRSRVDVSIPLEATAAAASQARGYLRRHGERFAETAALTVAQGVAEGRPTSAMVQDLRTGLGIVKSRAETIVRTESLRAYNTASDSYYAANNIDQVLYYATSDDRSCPICVSRAGHIYPRNSITTPIHPRCRCYLAPWSSDLADLDPKYVAMRQTHKREVQSATQVPESDILNKRGIFEQLTPVPLSV